MFYLTTVTTVTTKPIFFVFKYFHTHTLYSLDTTIYIYVKGKFAEQMSYGFKIINKLGSWEVATLISKIPLGQTIFYFLTLKLTF